MTPERLSRLLADTLSGVIAIAAAGWILFAVIMAVR